MISIHALLAESDLSISKTVRRIWHFYPRSPCGERHTSIAGLITSNDFYPRSPCGERQAKALKIAAHGEFLSTLSLRRATSAPRITPTASRNFYPRSPCGERPYYMQWDITDTVISIHALLAESDTCRHTAPATMSISIHALLAESDRCEFGRNNGKIISIHALLAESDKRRHKNTSFHKLFLSTLSLRRATISPHSAPDNGRNFYPRSPCGERQSFGNSCTQAAPISIHALLAESDANWFDLWGWAEYFYPRSPCGERPGSSPDGSSGRQISIHALLAESDA